MYVLDSDHLSVLQRQSGTEFENLSKRCSALSPTDFFLTIVSFHEQFNGWTKFIARAKDSRLLMRGYTELERVIEGFARAQLLPFSTASAQVYGPKDHNTMVEVLVKSAARSRSKFLRKFYTQPKSHWGGMRWRDRRDLNGKPNAQDTPT